MACTPLSATSILSGAHRGMTLSTIKLPRCTCHPNISCVCDDVPHRVLALAALQGRRRARARNHPPLASQSGIMMLHQSQATTFSLIKQISGYVCDALACSWADCQPTVGHRQLTSCVPRHRLGHWQWHWQIVRLISAAWMSCRWLESM